MSWSIFWSTSPTPCSIPEFVIEIGNSDGDRHPPRTFYSRRHAVSAAAGISRGDADHRRSEHLSRAGDCLRDPGTLAVAARSAAARAGAAAKTRERAIPPRHRRLRPRCGVADPLWRTHLAAD